MLRVVRCAAAGLVLSGVNVDPTKADGAIKIDGARVLFPITDAAAEVFRKSNRDVLISVGISGSGGGFRKFCRGELDVVDAPRPISQPEIEACRQFGVRYVELSIAFDALAVIVDSDNPGITAMTVAELRKMWESGAQGRVAQWQQINSHWAKAPLKLYGVAPRLRNV